MTTHHDNTTPERSEGRSSAQKESIKGNSSVDTKQMHIVRELSSLTGTRPELKNPQKLKDWMRRQCSEHCPDKHVHVGPYGDDITMPATARWTVTGVACAIVLYNVLPFVISDKGFDELYQQALHNAVTEGGHPFAGKA